MSARRLGRFAGCLLALSALTVLAGGGVEFAVQNSFEWGAPVINSVLR